MNIFADTAHKDITASTLPSLYYYYYIDATLEAGRSVREGRRGYVLSAKNPSARQYNEPKDFQCQRLEKTAANNRNSLIKKNLNSES